MRGKSGKFLHNVYTLTNKTKWKEPSRSQTHGNQVAKKAKTKSLTATHQVAHSDYKDTHIKDTHIRRIKNPDKKKTNKEDIVKDLNNRKGMDSIRNILIGS